MPELNRVEVIGHVGQEPELRYTPNGKPVANFSVAVNKKYTTSSGDKKEETDWFNIVVWNKLAESCNQFVTKGQLVFVSGRISLHQWNTPEGALRSRLEVNANTVLFLSRKDGVGNTNQEEIPVENREDIPF